MKHIVRYCAQCAIDRGLPKLPLPTSGPVTCTYCGQPRLCAEVPVSQPLSGVTEQLVEILAYAKLQEMTEDELKAASRELARRQRTAHEQYMAEQYRMEEARRGESHEQYAVKLAALLRPYILQERILPEPSQSAQLWLQVRDLVDEQRSEWDASGL